MRLVAALVVSITLASTAAAQQYTVQVLAPPADMPANATTWAYALNNRGQVFGAVVGTNEDLPILWTDGVPVHLPVPDGYYFARGGGGTTFLTDSGVIVANVIPVSNLTSRDIAVWRGGAPSLLPPVPAEQMGGCSETGGRSVLGVNGAGHVLARSRGSSGGPGINCQRFWIYKDGIFEILPAFIPSGIPGTNCSSDLFPADEYLWEFDLYEGGSVNFLNNADHVLVNSYRRCRFTRTPVGAGIVAGNTFTLVGGDAGTQINNHDQVLGWTSPHVTLWTAGSTVDLGAGGWDSMNNLGEVVIRNGLDVTIHANGAAISVPEASAVLAAGNGTSRTIFLNDARQIVVTPQAGQPRLLTPAGGAIADLTPPQIANMSSNQTLSATTSAGAVATWPAPTADDDRDGPVPVACSPASGTTFPVGTTPITCTAADSSGNARSATFTVTVTSTGSPTPPPIVAPQVTFRALGDLPGGPFLSRASDATKVGGVTYVVGVSAATSQTLCVSAGNPPGCVTNFHPDTAVLWTLTGDTGQISALPAVIGGNPPPVNNGIAAAITRDGAYIASQSRNSATSPGQVTAVRVARAGLANLDLTAAPFPAQPFPSAAQAISDDGSILYGTAGNPTRVIRFDVNGSSSIVIPLAFAGDTTGIMAPRGLSADGSIVVGTSVAGSFSGLNGRAFRYVHASPIGTSTAIPLLPGGTWSKALGVSPDGRWTLVGGDSTSLPNGEAYVYDAATGTTTRLGSPNTPWAVQTTGGMSADGAVVVATFIDAAAPNPALGVRQAYVHTSHGWFHLTAVLATQGIDLGALGWDTGRLQVTGISPDGTLVYGQGLHNGNQEGYVVEFSPGYLAAFDIPAVPQTDTAIVGVWTENGGGALTSEAIVFLRDGTYFHLDALLGTQTAAEATAGFERGRYHWDASTGAFTVATQQDTNGSVGLSGANGALGLVATVAGDTLSLGSGGLILTRVTSVPGSIAGGWIGGDPRLADSSRILTFFPDGSFVFAEDHDSATDPSGHDGIEAGTYVRGSDGATTLTVTVDTNGGWGFAIGPSTVNTTFALLSDELHLGVPGAAQPLERIVDPQTVVPVITSPTTANGRVGQPFTYTITATHGASFGWTSTTGLPVGLSLDFLTGRISGSPTSGGTFNVTISATNSFGATTSAPLAITIASNPPVAHESAIATDEDTSVSGILLATSPDGDPITFAIVTPPARGTLVLTNASTGSFTYTPVLNRFGGDSFTFRATAGGQSSNVATVTITVNPVNDAPVASDATLEVVEDTPATGPLIASDSDSLVVTFVIVTPPAHGTVAIPTPTSNPLGGSYVYAPAPNYHGPDSFTYRVLDGALQSNIATVTIAVAAVNDAPVASSVVVTTQEGVAKTGTLQATDVDGDVLTFSIVTPPTKGTLSISDASTGAFTYTPNAGAVGYDTFTFSAADTSGALSTATGMVFIVAASPRWPGQTVRASVSSGGNQGNGDGVGRTSLSADGRYVAFQSTASSLVPGDTNGTGDVFVNDRQTSQTTRVSMASGGGQSNGSSMSPTISADGRYVAFASGASNLVTGDTNAANDVFVHDRQTGQTTRVSVASDGAQANGASNVAGISADGRYVVFSSSASNLVPADTNGAPDVFVHDRQTGQTARVSVASDGTQPNGASDFAAVSADGRCVVFSSNASNLVPGDTNGVYDVFVHDLQTGRTTRVSVANDGTQANSESVLPAVSADGRYVTFSSNGSNLVPGDTNGVYDVFVHDLQTGQTTRVSVASDGTQANADSFWSAVNADGRYVAFSSSGSNLVPGDTNASSDIFVHDLLTGQTTLVSVSGGGAQGNANFTDFPGLSADARYVAFLSLSSNLVANDTNGANDIFVVGGVTVMPTTITVPGSGGTRSVDVSFEYPGTPWTATTTASWITINPPAGGSANGTVTFTIAPNIGPARTATLVAALQTITITQDAFVDVTPPTVTAPTPVTVYATQSVGATAGAVPAIAAFLAGATAVDDSGAAVQQASLLNGVSITGATVFAIGANTVTFCFRDAAGHVGSATSLVTVLAGRPAVSVGIVGTIAATSNQAALLRVTNSGAGNALNVNVALSSTRTLTGTGTVTLDSGLPSTIPLLAPGQSLDIPIVVTMPPTVQRFALSEAVTMNDYAGAALSSSATQTIIPRDVTAPTITVGPAIAVTSTSMTITWQTSEPATSRIDWGVGSNNRTVPDDAVYSTTHSVTITGLLPNTGYLAIISGHDAAGNNYNSSQRTARTIP